MVIRNCERENKHKSLSWVTKLINFYYLKVFTKNIAKTDFSHS